MSETQVQPPSHILYVDESLLVIDKPPGLRSLPDGYQPDLPHLKSIYEPELGRLWIIHRLDKDTSGVIVLARSAQAHRILNDAFAARSVTKTYHALVQGQPDWQTRVIGLPLRKNGDRRHRTVVDVRRGKPAETHVRVLKRFERHCLVKATPKTGRTHQIRAHLTALGLPLEGDRLYHRQTESTLIERQALHARSITFQHPLQDRLCTFQADYWPDMCALLQRLSEAT